MDETTTTKLSEAALDMLAAIRLTLALLDNLTTEEFSRGGDKPARDALNAAYKQATGKDWPD